MLLDDAHNILGWPAKKQILEPEGAAARMYADFAQRKIEAALVRKFPQLVVHTGILTSDPNSDETEVPIAVVCEFPSGAQAEQLDFAHELAWNFSRTALLITLEPSRVVAWSCYQAPTESRTERCVCELPDAPASGDDQQQQALSRMLHWVGLITGEVLRKMPKKFRSDGRADALLLQNLRAVRERLIAAKLPMEFCHDLLARIIFTQFLFHRKDTAGRPFFDDALLESRCGGALRKRHRDLASILTDKRDTYALFRWLNERFNGDLFPGKENSSRAARERAWKEEETAVTDAHLALLADLVSGKLEITSRQLSLWPRYSFDVIPLEFISSVYEEFLTAERRRDKAYYTPAHLVDFVLDAVLPWNGKEWDLRILDPSCGSGIFLVKAFQRLIHRWRNQHDREPLVSDLKPLLANNIVGVDKNPEAVRVACFSLYLAMADAIDPKHYLKRGKVFPRLRGTRLIPRDFFDEATPGFRTKEDAGSYDFVLGNAPWGDNTINKTSEREGESSPQLELLTCDGKKVSKLTKAEQWAKDHAWPVANRDIGPVFLAKAAALVTEIGRVAMIQPASTLLYHRAPPARDFRRLFFTTFTVDEVTNLSALRRELFSGAISPACVVVFSNQRAKPETTLSYFCPKPLRDEQAGQRLVIEPQDVSEVTHAEAAREPIVWSALAMGGRRDLSLALTLSRLPTLKDLEIAGEVTTRLGVIPGDRKKELPELKGRRYFDERQFPKANLFELDASKVATWDDPRVASSDSINFDAFDDPQLLIKLSYSAKDGRCRAVRVKPTKKGEGVICKKTYLSVRDLTPGAKHLDTACLAYNSALATYYLGLTSSRIGHYITELLTDELLRVPLPEEKYSRTFPASFEEVDHLSRELYSLTAADWALVEDFHAFTLPAALRKTRGSAHQPTARNTRNSDEPGPSAYARTFVRVLKNTFGRSKAVCSTVFEEPGASRLPVRMVAIHLDWPGHETMTVERMEADGLMQKLAGFYSSSLSGKTRALSGHGLGFQRVAFLFHQHQASHGRVRSLYIIKPDERRYWTRSLALRDADQLSAAIIRAAGRTPSA